MHSAPKHLVLLAPIFIGTLIKLQVSALPAISGTLIDWKPTKQINVNRKNVAVIKQEETNDLEADDDVSTSSDGARFGDFLRGINTILNGILALDFRNALGGTFQFIPPSVRSGVEKVVASIIGAPRVTTPSSLIFPEITTNNVSLFDLDASTIALGGEVELDLASTDNDNK